VWQTETKLAHFPASSFGGVNARGSLMFSAGGQLIFTLEQNFLTELLCKATFL